MGIKLPKFMIAENPMVAIGEEYVLHTRKPEMLIRVIDYSEFTKEEEIEFKKQLPVSGTTQVNGLDFILFPVKAFVEPDFETQEDVYKMAKLMRRAADWWHAYIKFENGK